MSTRRDVSERGKANRARGTWTLLVGERLQPRPLLPRRPRPPHSELAQRDTDAHHRRVARPARRLSTVLTASRHHHGRIPSQPGPTRCQPPPRPRPRPRARMLPRRSSATRDVPQLQLPDMYYRSSPVARSTTPSPVTQDRFSATPSPTRLSPRLTPLLPPASKDPSPLPSPVAAGMDIESTPTICGMPVKYVS